jgi:hypothetical protein
MCGTPEAVSDGTGPGSGVRAGQDIAPNRLIRPSTNSAPAPTRPDVVSAGSGLLRPSRSEIDAVAAEFILHGLAVEGPIKAHPAHPGPKREPYREVEFIVLRPARATSTPSRLWRSARCTTRLTLRVCRSRPQIAAVFIPAWDGRHGRRGRRGPRLLRDLREGMATGRFLDAAPRLTRAAASGAVWATLQMAPTPPRMRPPAAGRTARR